MPPFKTTAANAILDKILRNTDFTPPAALFMSLHTADPGETGANEVAGGSYARQSIAFAAAAAKHADNSGIISFAGMPACTVTHIGLWTLASGGVFWWAGTMSVNKSPAAGDTLQFAIADIDVNLTL